MSQSSAGIAIIGGGLSGLTAAMLLEQQGVRDVVLFEARQTLGGRILSVDAAGAVVDAREPALDRFDLGPSWFWPGLQPQLDRLVDELGLQRFAQFEDGDLLVERTPREAPLRMKGYASSPPSMRLTGGTGALIAAIRGRLDHTQLRTGQTVRRLCQVGSHIELHSEDASGALTTWRVDQVLLALPPRLAEDRITFEPPLPGKLASRWRCHLAWQRTASPSSRRCRASWPAAGVPRPPGWHRTRSTSPCMTRRSGVTRACPARREAHWGRWPRSTTSRCPAGMRRCSDLWVCPHGCGVRSPKPSCVHIAAHNSDGCLVSALPRPSRTR